MKTKSAIILFMVLAIISLLVLSGCNKEKPVTKPTQEPEDTEFEKPEDESLPNLPNNMFEEIKHNEPNNPELDDPNVKMIAVRMFQFGFDPEIIEVEKGNRVIITVTSADVGHGFALPDYGINEPVPPEETITLDFIADLEGEFEFFESVYSGKGWDKMKGKFVVLPPPIRTK